MRTYRDLGRRKPRNRDDAARVLRRQWDKAVRYVASSDRQVGDDPTFDARADAIATHVRAVQTRADAVAGRWASRGGPTDRRVLDVLCSLALEALNPSLEACPASSCWQVLGLGKVGGHRVGQAEVHLQGPVPGDRLVRADGVVVVAVVVGVRDLLGPAPGAALVVVVVGHGLQFA